jgi:hypothetical protein
VIVYLDNILIYSQLEEEYIKHIKQVLQRLRDHQLYIKVLKCSFHQQKVKFLGYIIDDQGTSMDTERIKIIQDWPEPKSAREIQVFLGFTGFFRKFIRNFSTITAPLSEMLKSDPSIGSRGFKLTPKAGKAFKELRKAFISLLIVRHFDLDKKIKIIIDTSKVG